MKTTNVSSSEGAKTATCSLTGRLTNIFSCPVPAYGILSASRCLLNRLQQVTNFIARSPLWSQIYAFTASSGHPINSTSTTQSTRTQILSALLFSSSTPLLCSLLTAVPFISLLLGYGIYYFKFRSLFFACFDFCFLLFVFFELKFLVSVNFCTILWNLLALFLFGRLD